MELKKYMSKLSQDELSAFAQKADTSINYLKQLVSGHRLAGLKSVINITAATEGEVTIEDLRGVTISHKKTA